ncbi:MAG: DNA polymerase ligase N-terminal domain-containing protein, partial [Myxococcota bacterium]
MRDLGRYRAKRDPGRTPEPFGTEAEARALPPDAARGFVVQQHAARALHYDLRLEIDGVLVSWAIPKGPSLDPAQKRLAVQTEDHPLEYADFEGTIPAGNYGAGAMIVWDRGIYRCVDGRTPAQGLAQGKLDLALEGHKLRGRFALVRTKRGEGRDWLFFAKGRAPAAGADIVAREPASVLSGLRVEELREGRSLDAELA